MLIFTDYKRCARLTAHAMTFALVSFGAPTVAEPMKQAVHAAVTQNPTALARQADVRASAMELLQNERDFVPRLSLFAEGGAEIYDDSARLTPAENRETRFAREIGVVAEYDIFDGYRRANTLYREAARVDGAIFRLLDASETLALNAVEAYIDVIRHRDLRLVADQNIRRHIEISRQVNNLVDAGRLSSSDRFEMEERLMAARLGRLQVDQAMAETYARYEAVIGRKPGQSMSIPRVRDLPDNMEDLALRSVRQSHQIKLADTRINQSKYQVGVDRADELPEVTLRAGVRAGSDLDGVGGDQSDAFVGVRMNWEFYAGGRKARSAALAYRTSEAIAERSQAVRDVRELAARTWISYTTNIERTVLLGRRLEAARKTTEQYQEQFQAGTRSLLDVLDAERTYFNIRFEEVSAQSSLAFSQFRILAAQSKLAAYFEVKPADIPLIPDFEERARADRPAAIFRTGIPSLE